MIEKIMLDKLIHFLVWMRSYFILSNIYEIMKLFVQIYQNASNFKIEQWDCKYVTGNTWKNAYVCVCVCTRLGVYQPIAML